MGGGMGGDGSLGLHPHQHINGGAPRKYQCKMCPQVGTIKIMFGWGEGQYSKKLIFFTEGCMQF